MSFVKDRWEFFLLGAVVVSLAAVIHHDNTRQRARDDAALGDCFDRTRNTELCRCWILNDCRFHELPQVSEDRSEPKVRP